MTVKTFTAKNMNDAMRLVRQQLGPDAAIMQSREVRPSGVLGWIRPGKRIEVTATNQPPVARSKPAFKTKRETSAGQRDAAGARTQAQSPAIPRRRQDQAADLNSDDSVPRTAHDDLRQKLISLQSVVRKMSDTSIDAEVLNLPGCLGQIGKQLAAAEVPSRFARELIDSLCEAVPETEWNDIDTLTDRLVQIVAEQIPTCGGIQRTAGQRRVVALVGPAGVGKTTMIAKLAAEYQLRLKRRVGLITADNFRIAAVDQLRTYADIIDVPLNVVTTPRDMRAAIQQLQDCEIVLIDTPGRSPEDDIKLQELKSILADGEPDEVHLVQSCVSTASHLRRCLERFSAVGPSALMLTKLDEATLAGHLLPILTRAPIPVSYVSDGQIVPDDMQLPCPLDLAKRLLATRNS